MEYPPQLSFAEKLRLYNTATKIALKTCITHGIGGIFRGSASARSLRVHIAHAMIRRLSDSLSDREYQYVDYAHTLNPVVNLKHRYLVKPTHEEYECWCRETGHVPDSVALEQHGAEGLWVGDKSAKHVMVFYHGRQSFSSYVVCESNGF